jgi:CheY-like chemotaxis protein
MPSIKRRNFSSNKLRRSPMAHIRKNGPQTSIIFSRAAHRKRNLSDPERGRQAVYLKPRGRNPISGATGSFVLRPTQKKHQVSSVAKTVLIADDSASMRLSVRLLLEGRHTELVVREATDGVDAIEKAKKSRPDLILLDLAMPRLNGAETATILKEDMPETPVILFTMYTDLVADSLCAAIGVDFISKADGVSKLLERVDALLPPDTASQTWGV